jgi:hypothetical protein
MQEDLNERYRSLTDNGDAASSEGELAKLSDEQGKLAELLDQLSMPEPDNPEDHPDDLPVIRPNRDVDDANNTDLELPGGNSDAHPKVETTP